VSVSVALLFAVLASVVPAPLVTVAMFVRAPVVAGLTVPVIAIDSALPPPGARVALAKLTLFPVEPLEPQLPRPCTAQVAVTPVSAAGTGAGLGGTNGASRLSPDLEDPPCTARAGEQMQQLPLRRRHGDRWKLLGDVGLKRRAQHAVRGEQMLREELVDVGGRRRETEEIETQAANQRDAVGFGRGFDFLLFQAGENECVDRVLHPIAVLDLDLSIRYLSPGAERLLGVSPQYVTGTSGTKAAST
jgi:PAS domain-containing protein